MKREWFLFIAVFLCSLLLAEGGLRVYHAVSHKIPPHWDRSVYEEWQWASEHLAAGSAYLPGQAIYHSKLGWVKKSNLNLEGVRTNSAGMRADRDFSKEPMSGTPRILFVGNSYTFGDGVSNEHVFHKVLQDEYLRDWEILNLGVSGYGPDQALLRYETEGIHYHPDMVVLGFYPRGFFRLFSRFRFYAKPYFVLDEPGHLKLENTPVVSPDELYKDYVAGRRSVGGWRYSYLFGTVGSRIVRTLERKRIKDRGDESWALMAAILGRFRDQSLRAGSQPFLLIFPVRPGKYEGTVYEDLDRMAQQEAQDLGIPCLSLNGPFLAELEHTPNRPLFREPEAGGHLSVEGHKLAAELLFESLHQAGVVDARSRSH